MPPGQRRRRQTLKQDWSKTARVGGRNRVGGWERALPSTNASIDLLLHNPALPQPCADGQSVQTGTAQTLTRLKWSDQIRSHWTHQLLFSLIWLQVKVIKYPPTKEYLATCECLPGFQRPALVMPCREVTAAIRAAALGCGWRPQRDAGGRNTRWKMWSLAGRPWITRCASGTVSCLPPLQVRWEWTGSRALGSACWGSRWPTARRAAAGTRGTAASRITSTTCWSDHGSGLSSTTPLCEYPLPFLFNNGFFFF